ncbi:hypothetical protein MW7_001215 [Imbroritus primus]|uniref:Uncharacterized protein n=1 Tax=Imbroritus primus TaxID=3058603 RepID=A0ACD3STF7_9BURK|nr:hypothetical protein MW7_001215 [Burkholderiaceae bacterium PBA]
MKTNPLDDFVDRLNTKHGEETWIPMYQSLNKDDKSEDGSFYAVLVSKESAVATLDRHGWDLMIDAGGPGFSSTFENGKEVTTYHRTHYEDFRRIAVYRTFHGRKEGYFELSEEFRLFHNLYHDGKSGTYLAFDETGDEVEVAKVARHEVLVRRSYLRSFMAATQMDLLLFFELTRHSRDSVSFEDEHRSDNLTFVRYSGPSYVTGYTSFTRILGKKLLHCDSLESCGVWPFERKKSFEEFIIGGDVDEPEVFSCDPDGLANYFGANPGAPHYLTPVFFKKEVMQKYYGSSEYEISDGHLSRHGAWSLRLDNNSSTHISVFLGDLGRDLPSKEQKYWRSFNIVPDGLRISETNFQRSFLGNFFDAKSPDLRFKYEFEKLQQAWFAKHGWYLFLPLDAKDEHFYQSIRSLLANQQSEFDSQVLALAKVTIDSVNVKALRMFVAGVDPEAKSISLLNELFSKLGISDLTAKTDFLRGVQSVRSTGVAHRKGTEYEKVIAKLRINDENYQAEFDEMLEGFVTILKEVREALKGES